MAATAIIFLTALVGADAPANVEVGWRPLPGGGMQYLIQLDPATVEILLRTGQAIDSYIPPQVKDVRGFQIGVGTGKLPRIDPPATAQPSAQQKPSDAAPVPPSSAGIRKGPGLGSLASPGTPFSLPKAQSPESPGRPPFGGFRSPPWVTEKPGSPTKEEPPRQLPADPTSRPFSEKPSPKAAPGKASAATFEQWVGNKQGSGKQESSAAAGQGETAPARPWTALTLALAGLFGSLGGNVYLGWLLVETRRRYRAALRRLKRVEAEDWDAPPPDVAYRSAPADEPRDDQ